MQLLLRYLIRFYQLAISPLLPFACRFTPTCSHYADEAIRTHGTVKGSLLAGKRLARCHPFGTCGHDPVPPASDEATTGLYSKQFAGWLGSQGEVGGSYSVVREHTESEG